MSKTKANSEKSSKSSRTKKNSQKAEKQAILEQTLQYEKKIYDLEQLLDIAKSFCSTLDFDNLLESIVYISMAQMHVLGAEIFVRDMISSDQLILATSKDKFNNRQPVTIPAISPVTEKLLEIQRPISLEELKKAVVSCDTLNTIETLSPTSIVPLIQKTHLNGILILQERIAIEDDTTYTEYEENQLMSIASLASVAINNAILLEMSSTDMMTHLKLKYFFFNSLTEKIDTAITMDHNVSVLMFDIDFFKKFNDTYGHECGDFVLIGVADLIKSNLRDSDIASRYGGEEFTVLLDKTEKEEALLVAERIRSKIQDFDFVYNEQHLKVTISGGVSMFDTNTNPVISPAVLVKQADAALYMSKSGGRNQVTFFDPAIHSGQEKAE